MTGSAIKPTKARAVFPANLRFLFFGFLAVPLMPCEFFFELQESHPHLTLSKAGICFD